MSNIRRKMELPAEYERNVFGQFDEHMKKRKRPWASLLFQRTDNYDGVSRGSLPTAVKIMHGILTLSQKRKYHYPAEWVNYALARS